MVEASKPTCMDSCGERWRDVAGARSGSGVAGRETRSAGFDYNRDADGKKSRRTAFGCKYTFGLRADGFLLRHATCVSANPSVRPDLG